MCMIAARIPKLLLKNVLLFFTVYKNEWKGHKFLRQKKSKKATFTKNIYIYSR